MKTDNTFDGVCRLVESGFTISEALDDAGISSTVFYNSITEDQKLALRQFKKANRKYGTIGEGFDTKDLHEFFTDDYAY